MKTHRWFCSLSVRLVLIATLLIAALLIPAGTLFAATLICNSNLDYFTKRCTVHPNAVTKIVNGMVVQGHLIGCQFKSYICLNGVCEDNYGPTKVSYSIAMDDLPGFCSLLCRDPMCTDPQGWR